MMIIIFQLSPLKMLSKVKKLFDKSSIASSGPMLASLYPQISQIPESVEFKLES
jgi:hypothetical protein